MSTEQFKENILTMAIRNMQFLDMCESTEKMELLAIHTFHIVKVSRKFKMFWLCYELLDVYSKNVRKIFLKNMKELTKTP